jgi:potassium-transporting ATPase KdpC subunit
LVRNKRTVIEGMLMQAHLRANLWLLGLTVMLCAVIYPLILWGIGQTTMRDQAQGSIIVNNKGEPIGSRLIAQEFKGDEYFQPRPSAVNYKAEASGATNYAANNYLLRDSVARRLGPIVRYGKGADNPGELVGPDIDTWFQHRRFQRAAQWAAQHRGLAEQWIKDTDSALKPQWAELAAAQGAPEPTPGDSFLKQLRKDDTELFLLVNAALKDAEGTADLAKAFFPALSQLRPRSWLIVEDYKVDDKVRKQLKLVQGGQDIQAIFFDTWRQEHPEVPLEEVPADMVTGSASGLDPHITLKNAQWQFKYRIRDARAKKVLVELAKKFSSTEETARQKLEASLGRNLEDHLSHVIGDMLQQSASAPLGGLAGVPLINVLEINLALDRRMQELVTHGK